MPFFFMIADFGWMHPRSELGKDDAAARTTCDSVGWKQYGLRHCINLGLMLLLICLVVLWMIV